MADSLCIMERIHLGVDASPTSLGRTIREVLRNAGRLSREDFSSDLECEISTVGENGRDFDIVVTSKVNDSYFDPDCAGEQPLAFYPLEVCLELRSGHASDEKVVRATTDELVDLIIREFDWPLLQIGDNGMIVRTHSDSADQVVDPLPPERWTDWDDSVSWPPYQVLPD